MASAHAVAKSSASARLRRRCDDNRGYRNQSACIHPRSAHSPNGKARRLSDGPSFGVPTMAVSLPWEGQHIAKNSPHNPGPGLEHRMQNNPPEHAQWTGNGTRRVPCVFHDVTFETVARQREV